MTEKLITSRREYERTTGHVEAFLLEVAARQSSAKEMSDLLDISRPDIEELRSMKESLKREKRTSHHESAVEPSFWNENRHQRCCRCLEELRQSHQ
ncbi:Oidioi.mRNA.OKI2018_I69.chr2.g4535.t1.cds [Oikopleura dioica]|uniref:Oidioi.mRNA.OKI2018_I69.chr2.g4535.t1.cds n=1 Tax=Oikopleura dioica TaxID=34765 RepID=A0ABN7SXD9_OIKDI|nr:Oidioi.mRNA.OKI2018_I69.chr2.g4535.t1.cds [Oikopleura dioica]